MHNLDLETNIAQNVSLQNSLTLFVLLSTHKTQATTQIRTQENTG